MMHAQCSAHLGDSIDGHTDQHIAPSMRELGAHAGLNQLLECCSVFQVHCFSNLFARVQGHLQRSRVAYHYLCWVDVLNQEGFCH